MELSMWISLDLYFSASLIDLNRHISILLNGDLWAPLAGYFYLLFKYWELILLIQKCTYLLQWTWTKWRDRKAEKVYFLSFFIYWWPSTCRCLRDESGNCRQNKHTEQNGNSPCFYSYTEQYHLSVSSSKIFHSPSASIHFNSSISILWKIWGQGVLAFS